MWWRESRLGCLQKFSTFMVVAFSGMRENIHALRPNLLGELRSLRGIQEGCKWILVGRFH